MSAAEAWVRPTPARRAGTAALIVGTAGLLGFATVGVLSRLAMFLLAALNPIAGGVVSDDDFVMGRFTLAGSLNLAVFGLLVGLISGLVYLVLERLRFGPAWFRVISLSGGAGVVVASQVVHADGVDFTLLEPLWLTVTLFVAIPVLHVGLLEVLAVRIRAAHGGAVPLGSGVLAWTLRAGLVAVVGLAVGDLASDLDALR